MLHVLRSVDINFIDASKRSITTSLQKRKMSHGRVSILSRISQPSRVEPDLQAVLLLVSLGIGQGPREQIVKAKDSSEKHASIWLEKSETGAVMVCF